ncbi:MAG: hypothetical protein GOV15_02345 [Candidatus Diapherotrites archaeon]|nr:hypothetical protein [Candidatus Diapherotrites archaeon]
MAKYDKDLEKQIKKQLDFYSRAPDNIIGHSEEHDFGTYAKPLGLVYAERIIHHYDKQFKDKPPKEFRILETGIGNADMAEVILTYLQENRPDIYKRTRYTTYDFSRQISNHFKKKMIKKGHGDKVDVIQGDATQFALRGGSVHMVVSNEIMDDLPKLLWTHDEDGLKEVKIVNSQEILRQGLEEGQRQLNTILKADPQIVHDEEKRKAAENDAIQKTSEIIQERVLEDTKLHHTMRKYLKENGLHLLKSKPSQTLQDNIHYHDHPLDDKQPFFEERREDDKVGLRTLDLGAIDHAKEVMRVLKPNGVWLTTDYMTGQYRNRPDIHDKLTKYSITLAYVGKGKNKNETSNINSPQIINAVKESGGRPLHADHQGYFAKRYTPKAFKSVGAFLMPTPPGEKTPVIPHFFTFEFRKLPKLKKE